MFKLYFATPDKKIVSDADLEEITLPAHAGELNILPGHLPLMTVLEAGILRYKLKNLETQKIAISWGYCQISPDGVTVLAESAVLGPDVDTKLIHQQLQQNEAKLVGETLDDAGWEQTQHEIALLRAELALLSEKSH